MGKLIVLIGLGIAVVGLLVMLGGNPVYSAPADLRFGDAMDKVALRVHLGLYHDETASLAQAVIARRDPNPRDLSDADLAYEVDRLTIDLEERSLDERADYINSALAEAEQAADRPSIDQLLRESQAMNEQRKSLHLRRNQTHLLTSATRR